MPLLDGDSLVEVLDGAMDATKIVLHSGHEGAHLEMLVRRCKAAGYLQKTADSAQLLAQVRAFLGQ